MRFLATDIFNDADTMEKALLQLLTAYHYVASGVTFKLREAIGSDSGNAPVISWTGPYDAADGSRRITVVTHFEVEDDVLSPTRSGLYTAATEMTNSPPPAAYVGS